MTLVTTSRDALAKALFNGLVGIGAVAVSTDHAERMADALLASGAVADVSTLADDETMVERVRSKTALAPGAEFIVRWVLRALAAALEGGDNRG